MAALQVVGGGRMGEALVGGLLKAGGHSLSSLVIVEPVAGRRAELETTFPGVDVVDAPTASDGTVLAVKPNDVPAACRAVAQAGSGRVLSIAAGVTIATLEEHLAPGTAVVRAMPNTPALVGLGASAIAAGTGAGDEDLEWAERLLAAVGVVVRVKEPLLDAVTGLSGSGPAYVFLMVEALVEAGVLAGLPRDVSEALSVQTLLGSATLLSTSDEGAESLRAAVTSPGGTTAAGLRVLEQHGFRSALLEAVAAATARSRELGGSPGQQPQRPL
ncbi:MAG: pyrroline-5-carboxylate reductase [Acidimicrobiales bacterium]